MQKRRLGCLTSTGIISALVTVLIIAGFAYVRGGLLYNPGPLNAQSGKMLGGVTSHAQIGGDCEACHAAPWESAAMADRCVICHINVASQIQNDASMHGAIMHDNPTFVCRDCHPEHRGADAQLTVMGGADFDHSLGKFSLTGGHAELACEQCHGSSQFAGLSTSCASCHADPAFHAGMFGLDCAGCHTTSDWFARYNGPHPSFGEHGGINHEGAICRDCHTQPMRAATCTMCHENNNPGGESEGEGG